MSEGKLFLTPGLMFAQPIAAPLQGPFSGEYRRMSIAETVLRRRDRVVVGKCIVDRVTLMRWRVCGTGWWCGGVVVRGRRACYIVVFVLCEL